MQTIENQLDKFFSQRLSQFTQKFAVLELVVFSIGGFGSAGYDTYAGRPGDAADIEVLRRVLNERQFQEHMSNLPEYNPNSRFDVEQFQRYMSDVRNQGPRVASRLDYDQPQMTDIDIFGSL